MKYKLLILLVLFALVFTTSNSQTLFYGARAGISLPTVWENTGQDRNYTPQTGIYFGGFLNYRCTRQFSIQGEINYAPYNLKLTGSQLVPDVILNGLNPASTEAYANFNNRKQLNYLEIPVLGKVTLRLSENLFYFVEIGPYVAIPVQAKTMLTGESKLYTDYKEEEILKMTDGTTSPVIIFTRKINEYNNTRVLNFGLIGGLGLNYKINKNKIQLESRFTDGFANIYLKNPHGSSRPESIIITIGYVITIK